MKCFAVLLTLLLSTLALRADITQLQIGSTAESVRAALGAPQGEIKRGELVVWQYPQATIKLRSGKVFEIVPVQATANNHATNPSESKPASLLAKVTQRSSVQKVKEIRNNGSRIAVSSLTEPGMVTIVDFFADWCGPCRKTSPILEKMTARNKNVVLRKVDIVDWNRPVVQQYKIPSIPYIVVYDQKGQAIGQPTSDPRLVERYVLQALKQ